MAILEKKLTIDSADSFPQEDIQNFLRPILFGLAEEDLEELARAAVPCSLPAGAIICQEGEPGNAIYVVVEGRVEITKKMDAENERFLHSGGPGELFGEMAILQEGTRSASVRTTEPTTLLKIDREPFLTVLGRSPALGVRILVRLTSRLRDTDQQAITELRQANEELKKALRRLERLDRTKSDFIQVSAHELRTPVAALLGYAQMMRDHPTVRQEPKLQALVKGTLTATKRLHRVFNNILDVSRLMTEQIEIHRSPVSIPVTIKNVVVEFTEALEERNLTLEQKGLQGLPLYQGDPILVHKLFYHLVNNAVKHTPDGGRITVVGRTVEVAKLGRCIEVTVKDTGIGIPPGDLDLIFETFYRTGEVALYSSGATNFKGGGPGLGLAIARGAVQAHGGRIWAESPGRDEETCPGSRFVVQLPLVGSS